MRVFNLYYHAGPWPALAPALESYLVFLVDRLDLAPDRAVTLVFADDAFVQNLNAQYRGKDQPTNVLSFASEADEELGDLIFAYQTMVHEAERAGKPFLAHLCHLILHGTLHLLGHDHETDAQAEAMEATEGQILTAFGFANPYQS